MNAAGIDDTRIWLTTLLLSGALAGCAAIRPAKPQCGIAALPQKVSDAKTIMLGEVHGGEEMLIEEMRRLRAAGASVEVAAFDLGVRSGLGREQARQLMEQRDRLMAESADQLRKPGRTLVLYAGNLHALKYPAEAGRPERAWMAGLMSPPPDVSLLLVDRGGSLWNCNPRGCGRHEGARGSYDDPSLDGRIELKREKGYDGIAYVGASTASPPAVQAKAASAMPDALRDAQAIALGEVHGSEQMPRFAGGLVRELLAQGKAVTLGLEMGQDLDGDLEQYLGSNGDPAAVAALTASRHWRRESIATRAMLQLIDEMRLLRAAGKPIRVAGFDIAFTRPLKPEEAQEIVARRDRIMAANADKLREPGRTLVLFTGAGHAVKHAGDSPGREHMAALMQPPPDVSLLIGSRGGQVYGCTQEGCSVHDVEPDYTDAGLDGHIDLQRRPGYDGIAYVGPLSPSMPVKP